MAPVGSIQGVENASRPQFAEIQLSTFPQQGVQLVDNVGPPPPVRVRAVPHLRAPSLSRGVGAFVWALVFGLYIWLGGLAVGVSGGTAFIFGALVGFLVFLLVIAYGANAATGQPRRADRR
jgi:hypothetical protein